MTTVDESRHLTTGWEDHLPPEDTELRRFVLAWSESLAGPVGVMGGRVVRTPDAVTSDLGRPAGYYSSAVLLRPPDPDRWDEIAFKGGSEPGVFAVAWLMERPDGRTFSLTGSLLNTEDTIDEFEAAFLFAGGTWA